MYPFEGIYDLKQTDIHIEQVGVSASARGRGVGTALLQWADDKAKENGLGYVTLSVLKGNRAQKLYERRGFAVEPKGDCWSSCISALCTLIFVGRPYGCCSPLGAVDMRKTLIPEPVQRTTLMATPAEMK